MGNVQSSTSNSQGPQRTLTLADAAPTAPHLDFHNMPFLKPPPFTNETTNRRGSRTQAPIALHTHSRANPSESSLSIATSPKTPQMAALSPSSVDTEWNQGAARQPDIHHAINASPGVSLRAEIGVVYPSNSQASLHADFDHTGSDAATTQISTAQANSAGTKFSSSPTHSISGSSISSQLSALSQIYGPGGSPRTHRHAFPRHHSSDSSNMVFQIDASVPPEVPPHLVFPADTTPPDTEKENMLAMIEALEYEVEEEECAARNNQIKQMHYEHYHPYYGPHYQQQQQQQQQHQNEQQQQNKQLSGQDTTELMMSRQPSGSVSRPRSRSRSSSRSSSRSRSFSRSRSLSRSLSSMSVPSLGPEGNDTTVLRTDVYTRKCSSPEVPGLQPPESTDGRSSDTESDEPASPFSESSFALSGYNDGTTKLRVVNLDSPPQSAELVLPSPVSREAVRPEKYRVKSKAQLAEEEEMLRKRYARYGHTYRGMRSLG